MTTLGWLPLPTDFRQSLKSAVAQPSAPQRLHFLASISRQRLSFVETIQIDKAMQASIAAARGDLPTGFAVVRVALLASATVDHLLPAIRVAGLRRGLLIEIYTGPFCQYRQQLNDSQSQLYAFNPHLILLSLGPRDMTGGVPVAATAEEAQRAVGTAIEDLRGLWRKARENSRATVIQQSFLDTSEPLFGSYDRLVPGTPVQLVANLNAKVFAAAAQDGVLLLDIARAAARDGLDAWFDVARWLQGKFDIAPQAATQYGEHVARLIAAQRGLSKKCLVLDLDNTLWGGVVGDVGQEGLVLGEGSAGGEAHLALQRYAQSLHERGILLAVCSKNDPVIAEAAFRDHPDMLLKRSDISAFVANWTDKAENLQAIARLLNIGLDSLVFVDDNPAERARVRDSLPMVSVPELPDDPAHYVRCIADAGYFESIAFTDDDRQRSGQYANNVERDSLRDSSQSMEDFLRGLDMSVIFGPVTPVELDRATQLINKTNQFNTTTRRYSAVEVSALASAPRNLVLQFRLVDRFGDNGLVSVMILSTVPDDPEELEVVNWVMSCRVFGRQLEHEAMNIAVETARATGATRLRGDIIATAKNSVISNLYHDLGYSQLQNAMPEGWTRWVLDLAAYTARPTFISRRPNV